MEIIEVKTKSRPSRVYCGEGAFAELGACVGGEEAFVVTDTNVQRLYGEQIARTLPGAPVCAVPAGERHKNEKTLFTIFDAMLAAGVHRSAVLVALGGGVVGDMGGLAAALYMRGIRVVQVPTTLLAQVDSSVGGKTAIDYGGVKNVVGAFWQPDTVLCDPLFLHTLPPREIRCGLGEILKTGLLDAAVGEKLWASRGRLHDLGFLSEIAADCVRFKARVVAEDETEKSGVRKCLNLGHTTGHALELAYGRRSHGEYVLIGMWLESFIAEREGVCSPEHAQYVRDTVRLALPRIPAFRGARDCVRYALLDKKNSEKGAVSVLLSAGKGEYAERILPSARYADYLGILEERA